MSYQFETIGIATSCFKEKFGIPRQPGLVTEARATIHMLPPYDREEALQGLDAFSHIWLLFVFHANGKRSWKATVRPPRLGGNQRLGVFATRSGFRPNPIGLSVVTLAGIEKSQQGLMLHVTGVDLLEGTPIVDIKPYLPYCDAVKGAEGGFAHEAPSADYAVEFAPPARATLHRMSQIPYLERLITQMLAHDPRPAYFDRPGAKTRRSQFGTCLLNMDVRWKIEGARVIVTEIVKKP
jgi:tRNA-Thr(GGU) m(6)t(6)A37 methyltransferase TsaA